MYQYFYLRTNRLTEFWDTAAILQFLRSFGWLREKAPGCFCSQAPFLDVSVLKVKDPDSWSNLDFDFAKTNYIAVVTTEESLERFSSARDLLQRLEVFLNAKLCPDEL